MSNEQTPAPRFPGYREMAANEFIQAGDMDSFFGQPLQPTQYQGFAVDGGVGFYFRPIDIEPTPQVIRLDTPQFTPWVNRGIADAKAVLRLRDILEAPALVGGGEK